MSTSTISIPNFDLELSGGSRLSNEDLRGKRTVFYFYPKDDTPGCTIEGKEFTELRSEFTKAKVAVYGISPDSAKSHDKFIAKCNLGIPLISDPDKLLCQAFSTWVEKSMYGKTYMGVERSTFLVGPDLAIEREWRKVSAPGHAQEVLDAVK
jgi:peroxiredoxin Q/BCP